MKTILQMAMTVNGYIATKNDDTPWSDAEWENYARMVRRMKNVIIGRRTYELMNEGDDFDRIGNPLTVVVTRKKSLKVKRNNVILVRSPRQAVQVLKQKGFQQALVCGGGKLNSSFLKAGLIDEIYLDIEPMIFGNGILLFAQGVFSKKLELVSLRRFSKNELQLHYAVKKGK